MGVANVWLHGVAGGRMGGRNFFVGGHPPHTPYYPLRNIVPVLSPHLPEEHRHAVRCGAGVWEPPWARLQGRRVAERRRWVAASAAASGDSERGPARRRRCSGGLRGGGAQGPMAEGPGRVTRHGIGGPHETG